MTEIIIGFIGVFAGVALVAWSVYSRFFRSFVPNPKKWGRARAKVTGRHHYQVKNLSKYGGPAYLDRFEKSITYTVDGKAYKKYVDDAENGSVHIYYNLKNPAIIKTLSEIRHNKREWKSNITFVMLLFTGFGIFAAFLGLLLSCFDVI